jgi:hypothetical protein
MDELRKIHMPELQDLRSIPFNIDTTYAAGEGILRERYVNVSIIVLS